MRMSYIGAKTPILGDWSEGRPIHFGMVAARDFMHCTGIRALSAIELVEGEDGKVTREWHVSVSHGGKIPSNEAMDMVRRAFGMEDAFEDNHNPGVVRNLWLAIDPDDRRKGCTCVENEAAHEQGPRIWRDAPEENR
jgi:hypothetical protein